MSYPKKPPAQEKETERATKLNQKRDQIKNLLVNKFRGKFNIVAEADDFDNTIKQEVENFLQS